MALQHLPPSSSAEDVATALAEDGAVIVDDLADAAVLDRIESEMQPSIDATPTGADDFGGFQTRDQHHLQPVVAAAGGEPG